MLVLPDVLQFDPYKSGVAPLTPEQFAVAEAVRLSISIPLFFEPGRLAGSAVVDGGVTSNFPLWIFDVPSTEPPPYPTFGFRLVNKEVVPKITGPFDVLQGVIKTARYAHDRHYLQEKDFGRVINIDVTETKISATKFSLGDDDKDTLYRLGYQTTKAFFLEKWSWKAHLKARGFPLE